MKKQKKTKKFKYQKTAKIKKTILKTKNKSIKL